MGLTLKSLWSRYAPPWAGGSTVPGNFYPARFIDGIGSASPKIISLNSGEEILEAWEQCPPVVSIVLGKAQADITGKITFKYTGTSSGKEGEPVNLSSQLTARALAKLMARPNPLQTWRQFRVQQKIYTQILGFCPVLAIRPAGFSGPENIKMLWNLPPQHIKIHTSGKLFYQSDKKGIIEKIEMVYRGQTTPLPIDDIFILRDQYVSLQSEFIPRSRICGLQYPISNIIQAYVGANVMLVKRGALGILSNAGKDAVGTTPLQEEDKIALQEDFRRYGLSHDQYQFIITNATVQWQQMAISVKDLMLYEAIEDGKRACCDVFNYPYGLLSKAKNDTFHNKGEDKKSLYQDAIMPEADSDMEVYNEFFGLADKGFLMSLDYGHLEIFQVSENDKAAAMKGKAEAADIMFKSEAITLRRMREMLGEQTTADDDIYYSEWQKKNAPEPTEPINEDQNEPATAE